MSAPISEAQWADAQRLARHFVHALLAARVNPLVAAVAFRILRHAQTYAIRDSEFQHINLSELDAYVDHRLGVLGMAQIVDPKDTFPGDWS